MIVHAVRHAQSRTNAGLDTSLNSDLSPRGARQVERLVDRFRDLPIRAVYASPFNRCLQTAWPIAEALGLPVRVRGELFEYHGLEPGGTADLKLHRPGAFALRQDGIRLDADVPDIEHWPRVDETRQDMIERTRSMARYLMARWPEPGDQVLIISHGSPIARLIDAWLTDAPGPSFRFVIENATVNTLRHEKGVRSLMSLNEASHLVGLENSTLIRAAEAW